MAKAGQAQVRGRTGQWLRVRTQHRLHRLPGIDLEQQVIKPVLLTRLTQDYKPDGPVGPGLILTVLQLLKIKRVKIMMKSLVVASSMALSLMLFTAAHADAPKGHPEMHRALRALENTKHDLEKAAHDYDGHRAKALELTNQAISEVKEGLRYVKQEKK